MLSKFVTDIVVLSQTSDYVGTPGCPIHPIQPHIGQKCTKIPGVIIGAFLTQTF